jgi:hypothetical protein
MDKLNLPEYSFKISVADGQKRIFDPLRKKMIVLTPEEWVRQNFIQYLVIEKYYPVSLIKIEMGFKLNKRLRRSDILVYNRKGEPVLIVECKAPSVKISQSVFDQIARYNMSLKVEYLLVTNGIDHYCCRIDHESKTYHFLKEIPAYKDIVPE